MSNTHQSLRQACLAGGSQPVAFLHDGTVSADQLRQQVLRVAAGLRARPELRWALWFASPYEFLVAFLAAAFADKHIVLPGNMQAGTAKLLEPEFDGLLCAEPVPGHTRPQLVLRELGIVADADADADPDASLSEETFADVRVTLFTSGSTGTPKAVAKHMQLLEAELRMQQQQWGESLGQLPVVATVSHQHIYGLLHAVLWPFLRGAPFVDDICQYPDELIARVNDLNQAVLVSSPTHLARLPQVPVASEFKAQLAAVFSSGGLLVREPALAVAELVGCAPIEILGSTETGGVAWRQQSTEPASEAWLPLPGVVVGQNADGCLTVTAPHMDADTPFVMGDRVAFSGDGKFTLQGRADQIVKVEGKRLSLTEMQQRLEAHPIAQQARLAVVTTRSREEVGAVVVLSAEGQNQLQTQGKLAVNRALQQALSAYFERPLLPRRWRYVAELPCNSQGKVTASDLQQLLQRES